MALWNLYFQWCKEKGYKPSNGDALTKFINLIQNH